MGKDGHLIAGLRIAYRGRVRFPALAPGEGDQQDSRAIKVLGLASAFFRMEQVSQAKVFSDEGVGLEFMVFSFLDGITKSSKHQHQGALHLIFYRNPG
jgi:hypothetical protein